MTKQIKLSKVYKALNYEEALKLCPKGYRIPEIWELVKLACENNKVIFETEKGKWIFFWSDTKYRNNDRRLLRYRYGNWSADWDNLDYSNENGRVVFVK